MDNYEIEKQAAMYRWLREKALEKTDDVENVFLNSYLEKNGDPDTEEEFDALIIAVMQNEWMKSEK